MLLIHHTKQNKKIIIGAIASLFAVAIIFAGVLRNAFANTTFSLTGSSVELDGTSDGVATVTFTSPVADSIYSFRGVFETSVFSDKMVLTGLMPGGGVSPDDARVLSNEAEDGVAYFQDASGRNPMVVGDGGAIWTATYVVDKDTPAGNYTIHLDETEVLNLSEKTDLWLGDLTTTVTVTRNDPAKPSQVVTFRDGNNNPITEVTKYYGDERFVITKSVTTGDGAIINYHPVDDGTGIQVAHTEGDTDWVGVDNPGDATICAWVEETANYAATEACYTVHVLKKPLNIVGAMVRSKDYDGTDTAIVDGVTFEGGNVPYEQYRATGTFEDEQAGDDKAVEVKVTLIGDAVNHYTLNPDTYNGATASIRKLYLNDGNVTINGASSYTYTGSTITPAVLVTVSAHGGTDTLVLDRDYEVSYSDNVNVGIGHLYVIGKGNFTTGEGSISKDFTITQYEITESDYVSGPTSMVVGSSIDPTAFVLRTSSGYTLVKDTDYTVSITGEGGNIGDTASVTFSGIGNFTGGFGKQVTITDKEAQEVSFDSIAVGGTVVMEYNPTTFTHAATSTGDGGITYRSTDETVATVDRNSGLVTIVGVGDAEIVATAAETSTYAEGSASYNVKVLKKVVTISDVTVPNKTYDGTMIAPISNVTLSEGSLALDTDFGAFGMFNGTGVAVRNVNVTVTLYSATFEHYCFMVDSLCVNSTSYSTAAAITTFDLNGDTATAELAADSHVYNGSAQCTTATVRADLDGDGTPEAVLNAGTDYDVECSNNVNAGTADVTIRGKGNFTGSLGDLHFTISPFVLDSAGVSFSDGTDTYIYDPDGVEPGVTVEANVHGETSTLILDTDYEVEYTDNTGVGTGHAKITGRGNFTTGASPIDLSFTITKATIANEDVTAPSSIVDGHILSESEVSVSVNGHTLTQCVSDGATNCDYLLTITNNTGVVGDTVAVRVEGRNNYDGTVNKNVNIVDKLPQTVTFGEITNTTVDKSYGDEDFTNVATIVETGEGHGEISYRSTNESVARVNESGTVSIVGVGDADIYATAAETATYAEGSAKYTVHVDKKVITITDATVPNKVYDGTTLASVESVTLSESSLVYNTDYTAVGMFNDSSVAIRDVQIMVFLSEDAFKNYCFMIDVTSSDPNLIVVGPVSSNVGYYSTTATITPFTLTAENATADLTANSFVYNGSEKTPGATVKADLDGDGIKETTLTSEIDYDMNYENNINRGTGSATVSGKGNYAGSLTGLEFEIIPAPVENVVVTAPSQDYTGEALEPVPTVTGEINGSSMTFNAGDYYVIPHADFKNAGSYTFSVKSVNGGNYYFDSTDGSFTINSIPSSNPPEMTAGLKIAAGCTLAELGERTAGFTWTNPDTVVGAGEQTFPATYLQNNDSTNYTPIAVDVPVYGLKRLSVVTAIMGEGGEVTNPGDLAVEEDELAWTISPDEGYELESFVINSEDKTGEVSGGRFTMTAGTDNITAIVRFRKVYEVTRGAGQTHIRGVDGAAEFEIDADYYELFEGVGVVYVDGTELEAGNYDAWSGSTVISLKASYLDTLAVGEHTLAVRFDDGGMARTTFTVKDPNVPDEGGASEAGAADTGVFTGSNGGAVATGISVVAVIAIASALFFAKKKSEKE